MPDRRYWITHDDKAYNKLMADVQAFVDAPGERDVAVADVFTDDMFAELEQILRVVFEAEQVEAVAAIWKNDLRKRTIVDGFLKDAALGKKRLASMPDRVTNTIRQADGETAMRPTVINRYPKTDLGSAASWWKAWKTFMFMDKAWPRRRNHTSQPRRRRDLSPRNIRATTAASPRPGVSARRTYAPLSVE